MKWTEMEKVDDIFPKSKSPNHHHLQPDDPLEKRFGPPQDYDESNLILQLGSNDPQRLQACAEHTLGIYNFEGLNINCGCPSIESGGAASYGASLMKDASLTGRLVESMRRGLDRSPMEDGDTSISVKCRIAVFDRAEDMRHPLTDADYGLLKNYVGAIQDAGADHVVLHARPAVLAGISPVKNRIVPQLDYEFVERIAADFPDMDITLNGGVTSLSQLESLLGTHQSVMAGRWCLRRPLDLVGVEALLKDRGRIEPKLVVAAVERYVDYALQMASSTKQQFTMSDLCLPLFLIVEQLRDDYNYDFDSNYGGKYGDGGDTVYESKLRTEEPSLGYDEIESLHDIIRDCVHRMESTSKARGETKMRQSSADDDINFKRLSSSFKSLVGTKVANKWKRNRSEL